MQSTSFRLVWALVTIVLLGALVWVVRLAWLSNPTNLPRPARINTPQAMTSPIPPAQITHTATSTHTTVATIQLGNVQRIGEGGFSFRPPLDYTLEIAGGSVTMQPERNGASTADFFLLHSAPPEQFAQTVETDTLALFQQYADAYAQANNFQTSEPYTITVGNTDGYSVDLASKTAAPKLVGRIVLVQSATNQAFVMVGVAPTERWETAVQQFDAVLASVAFFPPVAATQPTVTATGEPGLALAATSTPQRTPAAQDTASVLPTPRSQTATDRQWTSYTNANMANAVTASINTIWVATDGGIVAWNKSNNTAAKFTTLDGLAANRTTTVMNCPLRGFGIIFGSEAGLQIFDNQTGAWKVLHSANSSMSFDDVSALYCDVENRYLVVGYKQHGLDIFDADDGVWRYLGQGQGLQNNFVEAVTVVGDREAIWVSSGFGISVVTKAGETFFYDDNNSALETNQITRMAVDASGIVWLGAQDALYKIDGDDWTVYDQRAVLASRFPSGVLDGLAVADNDTLWIGSSNGQICHFDPVRVQCQAFYAGDDGMVAGELTNLTIGSNGAVYYTTMGGGVSMFDGEGWRAFIVPEEPLLGNQIHALTQDSAGALWIASEAGLQRTDPTDGAVLRQFTQDNADLSSLETEVLHAAPDGGIWFGALGASYFNGFSWTSYSIADGLAGSLVRAIAVDNQGRTWFGTESGLSIWNGSAFFNLTRENGLPSDNIAALLADGDIMWIGAVGGGLFRFEKNQLQLFNTQNSGLPSDTITALAKDSDGALLIGHNRGLARFRNGQVTPINELAGYAITTVAPTPAGNIWVGTNGDGLFYFDGETWTRPPGDVKPPSPSITAILVDDQGSVWIGARSGGVIRYMP